MSGIFTDNEMNEQYQEDDDFNQQEELVSDQDMMDEQNEFERDFGDEFTEGAYFSESDQSEDILEAAYAVDSVQDITTLKFSENFAEEIGKYHFSTLQLAFDFYLKYSKSKGFSARKSKTFKNSIGEIYKQKFLCHRQGFREEKYYTMEKRKNEPRLETRTGCEARMDVKFVPETGRWHIFYFFDEHNHDLLDTQFSAMFPVHRKMSEADIMQMMNMLKSGISTSQIFGLLASQAGGYEFVGYGPRDMYDEIARQRRQIPVVARYVGSRYDLTSFVEHFQRCVAHLRFKEFNADYESTHGVPVMQTCIELLERYVAELYTHEIFLLFRPFLFKARSMRVLNIENNDDCIKYIVCKHGRPDFMWTVDFHQEEMIFMCTCLRMESFGIPSEYIVKVLVDRDICEIPRSLVLDRWTKKVKSALNDPSGFTRDAVVISRQSALMEFSKQLAAVAAKVPERYEETHDLIMGLYSSYKAADEGTNQPQSGVAKSSNPYVHQSGVGSGQASRKKRKCCSVCQIEGYKKTTCPWQKDIDNNVIEDEANGSDDSNVYPEPTAELDNDN
ncbi:hypothetical protein Ahy_B01g054036 [Arachis hypogaea]|uniref:FAR1 domain-containing protein n=1 Tax=Arachis hypogaea TaxID=3818 RepID=A0A445AT47_ARAHY|nr:hypothetical protein Ahy_B01g054036 [Arachis hypogaea]